jgi:hypothetical protein
MKKKPQGRRTRGHAPRCGLVHASQTIAHVLASFFHRLEASNPELAAEFRRDPLGIQGEGAAS